MWKLEFELQGLPATANQSYRGNWKSSFYSRRKWKEDTILRCEMPPDGPLKKAKVCLTRYSSSEPDYDGLVSSFKSLLDGLVEGRVLLSDKPSVIGIPIYRWEKTARGKGKVHVLVESVHE